MNTKEDEVVMLISFLGNLQSEEHLFRLTHVLRDLVHTDLVLTLHLDLRIQEFDQGETISVVDGLHNRGCPVAAR